MAVNTLEAFLVDGVTGASAGAGSTAVALPGSTLGTDAVVRVVNMGNMAVFCKLGNSSAVTATMQTGVCVMPGQTLVMALTAGNTYIAIITGVVGTSSSVNIATGV